MNVKLPLAFLTFWSVLTIACTQADPANKATGNSNPPPSTVANAAVPPPAAANTYVVTQTPANSTAPAPMPANGNAAENVPTATIRARNATATAGREVTLELDLESKYDITVMVFSLEFDPAVFTYVSSKISPGTPKSAVLTVNAEQTATGKLGAMLDSAEAFTVGRKPIMTVTFRVAADAPARDHQIIFSSKPARQSVSTIKTQLVNTTFEPATVRVTAAR